MRRTTSLSDTSTICFLQGEVAFHLWGTLQMLFAT